MILMALPPDLCQALKAGLGPTEAESMCPDRSAVTSSVLCPKGCTPSLAAGPMASANSPFSIPTNADAWVIRVRWPSRNVTFRVGVGGVVAASGQRRGHGQHDAQRYGPIGQHATWHGFSCNRVRWSACGGVDALTTSWRRLRSGAAQRASMPGHAAHMTRCRSMCRRRVSTTRLRSSAVDEKPPARVGFRHVPQRGTVLPTRRNSSSVWYSSPID
jgi:hypothetical protein